MKRESQTQYQCQNGATLGSNNLEYLDNCIDYFDDKAKIIIAVDSDVAVKHYKQN
jgi:hypothetical protein